MCLYDMQSTTSGRIGTNVPLDLYNEPQKTIKTARAANKTNLYRYCKFAPMGQISRIRALPAPKFSARPILKYCWVIQIKPEA